MSRRQQKGIKLNSQRLELKTKKVLFHGRLLTTDLEGLKPDLEKTNAIVVMPRPEIRNVILRLNRMVNYLSHFLPHLSDVMRPPRGLPTKMRYGTGMSCKRKLGIMSRVSSCLQLFCRQSALKQTNRYFSRLQANYS